MASRKRRGPPVTPAVVESIRLQLADLGKRYAVFDGSGYIVVNTIGPYDHNPYDYPLPSMDHPKVFRALYEAVDYAQQMRKQGLTKLKIDRVDGSLVPGTRQLSSQVVWRSWTPGEHGGWARSKVKPRQARGSGTRGAAGALHTLKAVEVREMTEMLRKAGYANPALSARKLAREGMGPHELAERIRHGKSGVGSLYHSHGMRDASPHARRPPPLPSHDLQIMTRMLTRAGYPRPASTAKKLVSEGIGPSELAFRLKVDSRPPARSKTRRRAARKR